MKAKDLLLRTLALNIASLKMDILREASPIVLGLFTIMFGLHADYAISRTMATIVPSGVGHFDSEPFLAASWRVVSMVACALFLCVIFIHASIAIIKMRLQGSMLAIYAKVFYAFYLSLSPWITLHLARLFSAVVLRDIDIKVDLVFIAMYTAGGLLVRSVVWILDRWQPVVVGKTQ